MLAALHRRVSAVLGCGGDDSRSVRRRAGSIGIEALFRSLSAAGRLHPWARPERHGVERIRDLAYRPTGDPAHRLDVWRPRARPPGALLPVVLYLHGGGFRILSKDTHWVFGLQFARFGAVVFVPNYRLAPAHPFPAALEDACAAYRWVVAHAVEHGGDPARVVLAGESAGANLATSLAIAACWPRPEGWAQEVRALARPPRAVWAACGLHEVTRPERFWAERPISRVVRDRILGACQGYLPAGLTADAAALASPLCVLEEAAAPAPPLPAFHLSVGLADPIRDDTRRLEAALGRLGAPCVTHLADGEPHAFQALLWRPRARALWRDTRRFFESVTAPAVSDPQQAAAG